MERDFFFCCDEVLDLVRPLYVDTVRAQTPEFVFGLEAGRRMQEGKMPQPDDAWPDPPAWQSRASSRLATQ